MKRIILSLLIIFLITFVSDAASKRPILVFGTCAFEDGKSGGVIWPEIAVDPDGKWRKATVQDLWYGQEFKTFNHFGEQWPEIKFRVRGSLKNLPVSVSSSTTKWKGSWTVQVVYSKNYRFVNKGAGEIMRPEEVDPDAQKEFKPGISAEKILQNVVKADWKNIKKDFPNQSSSKLTSFLVGDINGDGSTDYVLTLGRLAGNADARSAESVLLYVKDNGVYKRIPIRSWLSADFGPVLLWTRDFNGDKADEIFIGETDSEETIPFVFGWNAGGLVMLYAGDEAFQGGM